MTSVPKRSLVAVWALATVVLGVLGWLLLALAEDGDSRAASGLLLGLAVVGGVPVVAGLVTGALALRTH